MKKNLEIVITMGGLGKRFKAAGYDMPKYMILAKGRTLFEWSLTSLLGFNEIAAQYIFVAAKSGKEDEEEFIISQCKKLNINKYQIIILDNVTDGQATTAMMAEKYWKKSNGLLIYNIDTYVEAGEMKYQELKGDGFIPCFRAEGNHWSFVRLDEQGKAVEIKEKERISDYCTLGAYYFKTCELYAQLYNEYYAGDKNLVNGEKYIAPLYNYLLNNGGEIYISDISANKVHVLGTPEELNAFISK